MKKFSKITENKQFLGWSKERILNEFKTGLDPVEVLMDVIYVSKEKDGSIAWNNKVDKHTGLTDIEQHHGEDILFSPMFLIMLKLGKYPPTSDFHEVDGVQVDNWVAESIKSDFLFDVIRKLEQFLESYKNDFFISFECSGLGTFKNEILGRDALLEITISLVMKDEFEYEQII